MPFHRTHQAGPIGGQADGSITPIPPIHHWKPQHRISSGLYTASSLGSIRNVDPKMDGCGVNVPENSRYQCAQTAEENIKIHKTIHYLLFFFHLGVLKDFVMIALPSCVYYNVSLYFDVGCLFRRYIYLLRFKTY